MVSYGAMSAFAFLKDAVSTLFLLYTISVYHNDGTFDLRRLFPIQHAFDLYDNVMDVFLLLLTRVFCFLIGILIVDRLRMENYFFGEEDDSSRRDGGEIPPSDDNNVADTNNEYYLNILRSRARRRQRGGKVSTLYQLFTFFLHSGTAIFVAIKCLFFDFPDAEHSGGLVKVALPLLVVWINVELLFGHFYIQKGLSSTDDYRPALHVHPVYYRVEVMGTVCDQCRQLLKAEGFKCPTCNEDICSECFLSKPRATAEEKEALLHPVARAPETMEDNSEKSEEENFTSLASRCVWLFKPQWKVVLLTTFFLLATESLSIVVPKLQGHVLDTILTTTTSFKESLFIFVGVSTVVLVLGAVKSFLVSVVIRRLRVSIRQQMFDRLIYAHLRFFDATKVGTLTSRMTNDLEGMISPLESMLSNTLSDVFSVLGGLVMCVFISWRLSLVALTIIGPVAYLSKVYMTWSFYIWRRAWDSMSEANSIVTECFQNIRTIRSFSSEPREEARHSHMIGQARKNVVQDAVIFSSVMAVSDLVRTFSSVLLLGFGGYIVYSQPDHLTIGGLVTFQLYVNIMTQSFNSLLMEASDFTNSAGAAQRVFSLLNAPSVRPYNNGVQLPQMEGALTLKEVTFAYPSRTDVNVLSHFNLTFPANRMTALVGHSGGGKSTLVHLLLRLYDPQEGEVLLDDTPLQSVDLHWYHNNVAVVAQDTQLFNGTVADNIQYGLQNVRVEDLHTAAKEANAYDFIMDFPEQFDTLVGENGVRLSGGQRQRIAIARALLRKPKILFLDEATSALDAESEVLVQAALDSLVEHMQHCTVIIIAHRLSTIRKAHRIVVVGDGAVAEEGTHDELLSRNGVYARLIAHQLQTGGKTLEFDGEKEDKEEKGEDE